MSEDEPEEQPPRPAAVGDGDTSADDDEGATSRPAPARSSKKRRAPAAAAARRRAKVAASDEEEATTDEERDSSEDDEEEDAPTSDDADRGSPLAPEPKLPTVPSFALSFPQDPALDELVDAFEKGNYARVRREAPLLVKRSDQVEVRRAARELERRVQPDPLSVYLLVAASLLLIFLALWYWTHPHEAP